MVGAAVTIVSGRRASRPREHLRAVYVPVPGSYPPRGARLVFVLVTSAIVAICMIWAGGWLLVQRQTGTRVQATVTQCRTHGSGQYRRVHCDGTWIIGGTSLLDPGSSIVVGTVDGADTTDVGKTIDATLSSDGQTAYSRDLLLPMILIVTGLVPAFGVLIYGAVQLRKRFRRTG
jgi:hypothetical protein